MSFLLFQRVLNLLESARRGSHAGRRRCRQGTRRLELDRLEDRVLPSVNGLSQPIVTMTWHGEQIQAKSDEWIASFAGVAGSPQAQTDRINALLSQVRPDLSVVSTLGQDGLVTTTGLSRRLFSDCYSRLHC